MTITICTALKFLSTLSLRRATCFGVSNRLKVTISIHALLAESDFGRPIDVQLVKYFYPRSPCGERPPRGGPCYLDNIISIHALLAESDTAATCWEHGRRHISIHALLAESDFIFLLLLVLISPFLSTLSLRRATIPMTTASILYAFLSTLSLRRATIRALYTCITIQISIHALLAESDL